ncbi:hypothetical protein ACT3XG_06215 [Paenibacillus polymyxa]|jgi:hypothetical protein|uniref:hypothetical protein n=1 Tax=Paenibacillus TaxID=44249 RepID=UPI000308AC7F|nr:MULTISPECIES: hypothetical protein [Paenibacillus]AUS25509.1 hypothetical protein C1A50_1324 [Paenibacillus polymyxa]KAF6657829.1 hypothetical protein HFD99_06875 [Paenibacillus sp. EKM301P]MBY7736687.1 hypothetical protein [Paenibacillus polymyxa]UBS88450.1 hypothetical protein LAZ93_06230 [Paenibacillus polymyxa]UQQ36558.1 hypothetical protein LMH85_06465 [Paenibacillus polymyxa]
MFDNLFLHEMSIFLFLGSELLLFSFALIFIICTFKQNKAMHRLDEILAETTHLIKSK